MTALAYNFKSDGLYYNILSETDRTVEVTYYRNDGYGSYYNDAYGDIEIPSKLIYDRKTYKVTSIGKYAFYKCSGLTSVTIPNSVTSIGISAFYNCSGLTSVTIGNSVTSIGNSAFSNCSGLISIIVDESNPSFSSIEGILYNNDATTLIYCPITKKTVTIPNSVTSIGYSAFSGCSGLTSVTIPNSVTSIDNNAFYKCSGLTSVTIPNSVTSIGQRVFENCSGLTSVTIGNSVTSIGYYAFDGCYGLTSVTIPNSVTTIVQSAFSNCRGLTSVTIGNSVTSIGKYAFSGCSKLTSIYCQGTKPPRENPRESIVFSEAILKECTLYVPIGCQAAYEAVDPWRNFWNIEEMDFSGIDDIISDNIGISVINRAIHIDNADGNMLVEVFNLSGKSVYRGHGNIVDGLSTGIYIIKIADKSMKIKI
ncbi:leucine-rich repeat domain-containing protein [Muribaculum intestinale]|uniref:leucine-rich repeat domain-containing protein n=3 Tax=Muribaculum intestinale TaxID=1796646 RepID=UPI00109347D8|nr:leucine-rich repeat domain-containing protein [Muribaculum intestinale]TGX79958.1 leucine-rich repeat domain-containing protein [Muribaculum intestinale]